MEASEMQEDSIARHKPKRGIAEKLINFTEDEEQQYEEQSDPEETFVKPKNPPRRVTRTRGSQEPVSFTWL